jgi:hypothetical protein
MRRRSDGRRGIADRQGRFEVRLMEEDMGTHDYSAWSYPRRVWESVEAFLTAHDYEPGIHSINCDGPTIDLLFIGDACDHAKSSVLPVFFSGAVTAREKKRPPFFSCVDMACALDIPAVCVADASIALDPSLGLAWHSGSERQALQSLLVAVLHAIALRSGKELLLTGGSGGGYAALFYGYALGAKVASVLAINPQTDWLEYDAVAVRQYLNTAFPTIGLPEDATFKRAASDALKARGVVHALTPMLAAHHDAPRRFVYLQNVSDVQVLRHAAPFIDALECRDVGDGFHLSARPDGLIWFGNWGLGHAPAPKALIENLLRYMLDPCATPAGLMSDIRTSTMSTYVAADAAPKDLRGTAFEVNLKVATTGETLRATARLLPPPTYGEQLRYAFYAYSGQQRIATRWYEPADTFEHGEIEGLPITKVAMFVRDAFGHPLSVQETHDIQKVDALPQAPLRPGSKNLYVYGSCVTRDAFAFAEHNFVLAGYLARSSLASAFDAQTPPPELLSGVDNIASRFQRRMVHRDLTRSAAQLIAETPFDAIVLDLIDERFALLDADGALVTISVEFMRTGYRVEPEKRIASGSAEHLAAWRNGLRSFLAMADPGRVIVNRVRWATHCEDGEALPDQAWIARNNETLETMYEHLTGIAGLRYIDYPRDLLVADRGHKWGLSPFHYTRAMYAHTIETLNRLLQGNGDAQPK